MNHFVCLFSDDKTICIRPSQKHGITVPHHNSTRPLNNMPIPSYAGNSRSLSIISDPHHFGNTNFSQNK